MGEVELAGRVLYIFAKQSVDAIVNFHNDDITFLYTLRFDSMGTYTYLNNDLGLTVPANVGMRTHVSGAENTYYEFGVHKDSAVNGKKASTPYFSVVKNGVETYFSVPDGVNWDMKKFETASWNVSFTEDTINWTVGSGSGQNAKTWTSSYSDSEFSQKLKSSVYQFAAFANGDCKVNLRNIRATYKQLTPPQYTEKFDNYNQTNAKIGREQAVTNLTPDSIASVAQNSLSLWKRSDIHKGDNSSTAGLQAYINPLKSTQALTMARGGTDSSGVNLFLSDNMKRLNRVSFDMYSTAGGSAYGARFKVDETEGSYYEIGISSDCKPYLKRVKNGAAIDIKEGNASFTAGEWYRVIIEFRGTELYYKIRSLTFTGSDIWEGTFQNPTMLKQDESVMQLFTSDVNWQMHYFDNLRVWYEANEVGL